MLWSRRAFGLAAAVAASAAEPSDGAVVLDLHCDTPMRILREGFDLGKRNDYGQVDIPRLREGGMSGVFFSVYTPARKGQERTPRAVKRALEIIDGVRREVARHPRDLTLATSTGDVLDAKRNGKIAILLGVEGGHMIDSSLAVLRSLYRLGARYLTLTHSAHLPWAGSSGDAANSDPGLTDLGREIVAVMNGLGMMVDLSHVSDKTFFAALEASRVSPIASHSSCRAINPHARNMTDEMIRRLADAGGVMHINFYNGFLDADYRRRANDTPEIAAALKQARARLADNPRELARAEWRIQQDKLAKIGRVSFDRLLDHFEHAVKVGGVAAVGLGSDFDGVSEELPEGMEDVSKIPSLRDGLRGRGFSGADVDKILGGNTMRAWRAVEGAAKEA